MIEKKKSYQTTRKRRRKRRSQEQEDKKPKYSFSTLQYQFDIERNKQRRNNRSRSHKIKLPPRQQTERSAQTSQTHKGKSLFRSFLENISTPYLVHTPRKPHLPDYSFSTNNPLRIVDFFCSLFDY
ncbi:MAG: hypothetical protein IK033_07620, partial [Verrucomicrobia bacterium]|nr:hypothetical protein [Verrucomicrobiota bacterium]